jgi:hypothetical protein
MIEHKHKYETDYRGYTCCQICGVRPKMTNMETPITFIPAHFNNAPSKKPKPYQQGTMFMIIKKKGDSE